MKDDNREDIRNLTNDDKATEEYIQLLEKRLKNFDTERQLLDAEKFRLEQELSNYKNEVHRLRESPSVVAVIVNVDGETGRAVVISSTGPIFVVNISRKVRKQKLEPGMFVSLNQRTYAIMEILTFSEEEVKAAKSKLYKEY
jgi:proteasome regulatory subunit